MSRAVPMCLPDFNALTNSSSVQTPDVMPVSLSGVRLAANDTPHGPDHAVNVSVIPIAHWLPRAGVYGAFTLIVSGWPASIMLMSGSGPFGPSFFVVWQS